MDTTAQKVWNQAQQQANSGRRNVTIDPITRLEGHGKIEIFLNDKGNVDRAYLQIPELRGFEVFCQGRPSEDMPQLTSRICGVCPTAHHMAATKALDDLYGVDCHPVGRKIRELVYNAFMLEEEQAKRVFEHERGIIVRLHSAICSWRMIGLNSLHEFAVRSPHIF